ncbi:hypothetical protein HYZ70_03310, partial [Candidatus Curtissbacteria bacterium]|nr:hypothetical protein [Candidatus Curtissbacteria bacterium]
MARLYSRLASVEEKKNMRRAFFFGILAVLTAVFFLTFGLSPLAKLSGFLSNLRNPQKTLNKADTTAPA